MSFCSRELEQDYKNLEETAYSDITVEVFMRKISTDNFHAVHTSMIVFFQWSSGVYNQNTP